MSLALDRPVPPLEDATRLKVNEALRAIAGCLNAVERHYETGEVNYEASSIGGGNAESLLYDVRTGLEAEAAKLRRLEIGSPDDE